MLSDEWTVTIVDPAMLLQPAARPYVTMVPSTVASLYHANGLSISDITKKDYWYTNQFYGVGKHQLEFKGLIGSVDIWLNDELIFQSDSMFLCHKIEVELIGQNTLVLHFKAASGRPNKKLARPRWRQQMIDDAALRGVRTTLLGHMPGWCPSVEAVGPYRAILCTPLEGNLAILNKGISVSLEESSGELSLFLTIVNIEINHITSFLHTPFMSLCGRTVPFEVNGRFLTAYMYLKDNEIKRWNPHTHGMPIRYEVKAIIDDVEYKVGYASFRSLRVDYGSTHDEFMIYVNDKPVFCRGACWTASSIVDLPCDRQSYQKWLEMARDAGMNMIRIPGTTLYEGDEFYDLCDEFGIMVWQDFMFANFDYPSSDVFLELIKTEVTQFLDRTRHNPCIAVLCGGSEVYQQAAMLGLTEPRYKHILFDSLLPELVSEYRNDTIYIPNSPYGGDWPFQTNVGATHYYGVGAYLKDFSDIRRSDVKFASECLALANVPSNETLDKAKIPAVHHPKWKEGVPRDRGVTWDFEDVRDHYLSKIFDVEPNLLRRQDLDRYLELSRAVSCILINAVYSEWRRKGSHCAGGLVLSLQDLQIGAGWGLIDSNTLPKAAYHGFKNVNQPIQILITDEGLNGVALHVVNDSSDTIDAQVSLHCINNQSHVVAEGTKDLMIQANSTVTINSSSLIAGFFDITYSYRFGPPSHRVSVARLLVAGQQVSLASHYPLGYELDQEDLELTATASRKDSTWHLVIYANKFVQLIHFELNGFRAKHEWIDVMPKYAWPIELVQTDPNALEPSGFVKALNSRFPIAVRSVE